MTRPLLLLVLLSTSVLAAEDFEAAAQAQIRELIHGELWGHYDVGEVTVVGIADHTAEWGGYRNGYGLKTVTARFAAVRNEHWSENLNRSLLEHCDRATSVYLLCQPTGHEFEGKLEVDFAFTKDGWKILSRNYRNLREFCLSNYLLLEGRPKEGYVLPPKRDDP